MIYTKDNPKLVTNYFMFEGKKTFTGVVKNKNGDIVYYLNGKFHREDGPAVYNDAYKGWWLYGRLHREDGPAAEYTGGKSWYLNDQCYGNDDDFTNESWIRFVKLESLK